jgi:hypothetical protein
MEYQLNSTQHANYMGLSPLFIKVPLIKLILQPFCPFNC